MIAVEWRDENMSGSTKWRAGVLISIAPGGVRIDGRDGPIAFVTTARRSHDPMWGPVQTTHDKIILPVLLARLVVKGVNIPFEVNDGT